MRASLFPVLLLTVFALPVSGAATLLPATAGEIYGLTDGGMQDAFGLGLEDSVPDAAFPDERAPAGKEEELTTNRITATHGAGEYTAYVVQTGASHQADIRQFSPAGANITLIQSGEGSFAEIKQY